MCFSDLGLGGNSNVQGRASVFDMWKSTQPTAQEHLPSKRFPKTCSQV